MTIQDALSVIDGALAQINGSRQAHAAYSQAVKTIVDELNRLAPEPDGPKPGDDAPSDEPPGDNKK